MNRKSFAGALGAIVLALATRASAESLTIAADDTIAKVLAGQTGKVVTLRLGGGEEITGKVTTATPEITYLSQLSGKEFYDAAVATRSVTAVVLRAR